MPIRDIALMISPWERRGKGIEFADRPPVPAVALPSRALGQLGDRGGPSLRSRRAGLYARVLKWALWELPIDLARMRLNRGRLVIDVVVLLRATPLPPLCYAGNSSTHLGNSVTTNHCHRRPLQPLGPWRPVGLLCSALPGRCGPVLPGKFHPNQPG